MKKLLIGILLIATVTAIFSAKKTQQVTLFSKPAVDKTLNGMDYGDASDMIKKFDSDYINDKGLKSVSAWFSKPEIKLIQNILYAQAGKIDGVRFYFGEISKTGTKIETNILLIPTKQKDSASVRPDHLSLHGDYPVKSSLLVNKLGKYYTNKASTVLDEGGLLYGDKQPPMSGICSGINPHRLNNDDTYNWVQKRHDKKRLSPIQQPDEAAYNTKSEWFDICFISSLFDAIIKSSNLDGLRIYLGEGYKEDPKNERDVFVLVPTQKDGKKHEDDFDCLSFLPTSLCESSNLLKINKTKPSKPELLKQFNYRYFKLNPFFLDGGYDKGELCPYKCN